MSVTSVHEGVVEIVRDHPDFIASLLRELRYPVPPFTASTLVDPTLNEILPVEHRADAVVVFHERGPVFGVVLESQIDPDEDKLFSWPLYAVAARARHKVPFVLVVVTPRRATRRWASQPMDLGNGVIFKVIAIGPDEIPPITERQQAVRNLELAVLSAIVHGHGNVDTAVAVARATLEAVEALRRRPRDILESRRQGAQPGSTQDAQRRKASQ